MKILYIKPLAMKGNKYRGHTHIRVWQRLANLILHLTMSLKKRDKKHREEKWSPVNYLRLLKKEIKYK
jgi:hypothetical protein